MYIRFRLRAGARSALTAPRGLGLALLRARGSWRRGGAGSGRRTGGRGGRRRLLVGRAAAAAGGGRNRAAPAAAGTRTRLGLLRPCTAAGPPAGAGCSHRAAAAGAALRRARLPVGLRWWGCGWSVAVRRVRLRRLVALRGPGRLRWDW
ncbi:hypothetical protein GCM10020229_15000 [Kitasatospora albolonga]